MPSLPTIVVAARRPSRISTTADKTPLCGKYTCSIGAPDPPIVALTSSDTAVMTLAMVA
jgi:hypothetical protein